MSQSKGRLRKTPINQEDQTDPIEGLTQWQDHLYDPGYLTGNNIEPLLTAPRPKRYGYVLILGGVIMLIFMVLIVTKEKYSWPILIAGIPFTVLVLLAGFKLMKTKEDDLMEGEKRSREINEIEE